MMMCRFVFFCIYNLASSAGFGSVVIAYFFTFGTNMVRRLIKSGKIL